MNYGWGFQWAQEYLELCLEQMGSNATSEDYWEWLWGNEG
jgi:hypothetical protein